MIFNTYLRSALLATLLGPGVAAAQTVSDPLKSQAPVLSSAYESAFTSYKVYQEPELTPWQTANDVVREFGGMSGMSGGEMKGEKESNAPGSTHDMGKMNDSTKLPASNAQAPSDNAMRNMPGHDMSKMQNTEKASKLKVAPQPNTTNVQKKDMADMPGHDMSQMKAKKAPAPAAVQPSVSKPATAPPRSMPDHSGMGH